MAKPVLQYDPTTGRLTTISTVGVPANRVLTIDGSGDAAWASVPYDVAGSVGGIPVSNGTCFFFRAVRDFTIAAGTHRAGAETPPSAGTTFTVKVGATIAGAASIGTFTIPTGGDVTFTLTPTTVTTGQILIVTAPANLNSLQNLYFTFVATAP